MSPKSISSIRTMIVIFFLPKKASSPVKKPSRQMKENSLSVFVCKNPFEGLQSTHNGPFCTLKVQLEVRISQDCGLVVIVRYHYRLPPYSEKSSNKAKINLRIGIWKHVHSGNKLEIFQIPMHYVMYKKGI